MSTVLDVCVQTYGTSGNIGVRGDGESAIRQRRSHSGQAAEKNS